MPPQSNCCRMRKETDAPGFLPCRWSFSLHGSRLFQLLLCLKWEVRWRLAECHLLDEKGKLWPPLLSATTDGLSSSRMKLDCTCLPLTRQESGSAMGDESQGGTVILSAALPWLSPQGVAADHRRGIHLVYLEPARAVAAEDCLHSQGS